MPKTSIKPMLNVRKDVTGNNFTLIIQVLRERKRSVLFTPFKLSLKEFLPEKGIAVTRSKSEKRKNYINSVNQYLCSTMAELYRILLKFENSGTHFSAADIVASYRQQTDHCFICTFVREQIRIMQSREKFGTAATYQATLIAFEKFSAGKSYRLDDLTFGMVNDFRKYLLDSGLKPNTVTFYLSKFRALYNLAANEGYVSKAMDPFSGIVLRIEPTRKLALNDAIMRKVAFSELPQKMTVARDLFMFCFYCRGMSFVDMAYLRHSDISDGVIRYRRHKTGQLFAVRILPETQVIIDRYKEQCYPMVLPILVYRDENGEIHPYDANLSNDRNEYDKMLYEKYRYARSYYLHRLQVVSKWLGLPGNLTFNMARHTWASRARRQGIGMSVISESLGHTSEKTTRIYLENMENKYIDDANRVVTTL